MIGGKEVKAVLSLKNDTLQVDSADVDLVVSDDADTDVAFDAESTEPLTLESGAGFDIEILGLKPDSDVEAVLFSDPVSIGRAVVSQDGGARIRAQVPVDVEPGQHSLVVDGEGANGEEVLATLSVRVGVGEARMSWRWLVFVLMGLGIVGALLVPAVRAGGMRKLR